MTNTGDCAGSEIVQLYIRDEVSSVTRPGIELKGFEKVSIGKGETRKVSFEITSEELSFTDLHYNRVVEPGTFKIMVGTSSVDYLATVLEAV